MKPLEFKLLISCYIKNFLPVKDIEGFERELSEVLDVHDNYEIHDIVFHKTISLTKFYISRIDLKNEDEVNQVVKLLIRFVQLGHIRNHIQIASLYIGFTRRPIDTHHKNRKFFDINDVILTILTREEGWKGEGGTIS